MRITHELQSLHARVITPTVEGIEDRAHAAHVRVERLPQPRDVDGSPVRREQLREPELYRVVDRGQRTQFAPIGKPTSFERRRERSCSTEPSP
jgi:hypothetical protein